MPGSSKRQHREGGFAARGFATAVIGLRHLIPLAWIAAAVAATIGLPQLGSESGGPIEDIVPADSAALKAAARATQEFGFPLVADTVVVQQNADGLPRDALRAQLSAAANTNQGRGVAPGELVAAVPINDSPAGPLGIGDRATTALTYLVFAPGVGVSSRTDLAQSYADEALGGEGGDVVGVTGPAPARQAQTEAIDDSLPLIEGASVLAVLLIVGLAFRSLGAPLVTLFTGAIAYMLMVRVVPWAGERLGIAIPPEVEPVLVVLLLGLVTDYSVFFLSGMRRRLRRGQPRLPAARGSVVETAPLVFAAGLIVTAGTAALLAGELDFFRAFGPGLAITTLVSMVVAATLVPALIGLFGPRLYGRRLQALIAADSASEGAGSEGEATEVRRELKLDEPESDTARRGPIARGRRALARPLLAMRRVPRLGDAAQTKSWRVGVARVASTRPAALVIAIVAVALLLVAASGLRSTELGLTFISGLADSDETKQAADAASTGFAPGVLAPTEVDLFAPGIADRRAELDQLETLVGQEPGVEAVLGPREQPPAPAPEVMVADDGTAARLAVVFDADPLGAPAIDRLDSLEQRMPALLAQAGLEPAPQVSFGGQTALSQETVDAVVDDLKVVGVVALIANLLLLIIFLRALVAPLYLVAASVLGLAATLGLATFFFQDLLGRDQLTYYVPFAASVLLVALGSDYNVFVAGRIWREAERRRLPEAIAVAAPSAAKAITVAGLALAASFALLAIVPLDSFQEFAFVMVVGVLIDTFVVRPMLVPALTALVGERAWWPGRRVATLSSEAFAERVAARAGISTAAAERACEAALTTLGERIDMRERRTLARQLPADFGACLLSASSGPDRFDAEEFLARMRAREDGVGEDETAGRARAVLATLSDAVAGGIDYVRVQLSEDYDDLLPRPAPREGGREPVSAGPASPGR